MVSYDTTHTGSTHNGGYKVLLGHVINHEDHLIILNDLTRLLTLII